MEEEFKGPQHRRSGDGVSELLKFDAHDVDKSEISEQYDIDPFFGRTVSMDAAHAYSKLTHRSGRSESIKNPILTSFWKMNDSTDQKTRIKPDKNYMKIEERGFTRHLMLEGKHDEVLNYLEETFPNVVQKDKRIKTAINCLKLVTILKDGKFQEAIDFGTKWLKGAEEVSIPALNSKGNYVEVTVQDFFSLIAFVDMESSDVNFLLNDWQREVIADMINETIVQELGGNEYSKLEYNMRQLNQVQKQIREERNGLGEIFQVKISK